MIDVFRGKIAVYKYFYMLMMFIWIGRASPYTGFNMSENPVLMPVYLIIIGYYYLNYCNKTYKPLLMLLSIFAVWTLLIFLKYGNLNEYSFQFIYYLIIVHVAFNIYSKREYLYLFEDVLVKLCLLSLVVWILVNVFPSNIVPFMHSIAVYENRPPMETTSILVGIGSSFEMGLRRNIGFSWEPGVFSCFVAMGLYVNMVRNRFNIFPFAVNRNFYVLLITLLTTLSTTGYVLIAVLGLFYLMNKSVKGRIIPLIIAAIFIPIVDGFSFMTDKIVGTMDLDANINAINYYAQEGMAIITPQRFAGFYFEWLNFIHDFWLGYGNYKQSYASSVLFDGIVYLDMSNGIVRIFAKYGIFVGIFFYYWMLKSSVFLSKSFHYKGKYLFALLFLTMSFSYDFWENNLLMFFYLSTFYLVCSNSYKEKWNS